MSQEIEFLINPDGTVLASWWNHEVAAIICALCGKGGGYEKYGPVKPGELLQGGEDLGPCWCCETRNPHCG